MNDGEIQAAAEALPSTFHLEGRILRAYNACRLERYSYFDEISSSSDSDSDTGEEPIPERRRSKKASPIATGSSGGIGSISICVPSDEALGLPTSIAVAYENLSERERKLAEMVASARGVNVLSDARGLMNAFAAVLALLRERGGAARVLLVVPEKDVNSWRNAIADNQDEVNVTTYVKAAGATKHCLDTLAKCQMPGLVIAAKEYLCKRSRDIRKSPHGKLYAALQAGGAPRWEMIIAQCVDTDVATDNIYFSFLAQDRVDTIILFSPVRSRKPLSFARVSGVVRKLAPTISVDSLELPPHKSAASHPADRREEQTHMGVVRSQPSKKSANSAESMFSTDLPYSPPRKARLEPKSLTLTSTCSVLKKAGNEESSPDRILSLVEDITPSPLSDPRREFKQAVEVKSGGRLGKPPEKTEPIVSREKRVAESQATSDHFRPPLQTPYVTVRRRRKRRSSGSEGMVGERVSKSIGSFGSGAGTKIERKLEVEIDECVSKGQSNAVQAPAASPKPSRTIAFIDLTFDDVIIETPVKPTQATELPVSFDKMKKRVNADAKKRSGRSSPRKKSPMKGKVQSKSKPFLSQGLLADACKRGSKKEDIIVGPAVVPSVCSELSTPTNRTKVQSSQNVSMRQTKALDWKTLLNQVKGESSEPNLSLPRSTTIARSQSSKAVPSSPPIVRFATAGLLNAETRKRYNRLLKRAKEADVGNDIDKAVRLYECCCRESSHDPNLEKRILWMKANRTNSQKSQRSLGNHSLPRKAALTRNPDRMHSMNAAENNYLSKWSPARTAHVEVIEID